MSSFHTVVELKGTSPMTMMAEAGSKEQADFVRNFKAWSSGCYVLQIIRVISYAVAARAA